VNDATVITDENELRKLLGEPAEVVRSKVTDHVDELTREFIDRSPSTGRAPLRHPGSR